MNPDIKQKLGELFGLCVELDRPDFDINCRFSGHIDCVQIEIYIGGWKRLKEDEFRDIGDDYHEIGFYVDKPDDDVLSDIHMAKFEILDVHNKFRSAA